MKPITREWVGKAEGDFATLMREIRARKNPNYDSACFHAQQCAEKYLKARLQEADIQFAKTHNLSDLLDQIVTIEPLWEYLRPTLLVLTNFAVNVRYPGEFADKAVAKEALALCKEVRSRVRECLGLEKENKKNR